MSIESEDFYNLMQAYRHAAVVPFSDVSNRYQDVINHIDEYVVAQIAAAKDKP